MIVQSHILLFSLIALCLEWSSSFEGKLNWKFYFFQNVLYITGYMLSIHIQGCCGSIHGKFVVLFRDSVGQ